MASQTLAVEHAFPDGVSEVIHHRCQKIVKVFVPDFEFTSAIFPSVFHLGMRCRNFGVLLLNWRLLCQFLHAALYYVRIVSHFFPFLTNSIAVPVLRPHALKL